MMAFAIGSGETMIRRALVFATALGLVSCGPSPDAMNDGDGPVMSGPVYTSDQARGINHLLTSFIARKKTGMPDAEIELVFQPDFKYSRDTYPDPGGVVLLRLSWPASALARMNFSTVTANELAEAADVSIESGNGITTLSELCPDEQKAATPQFCNKAVASAKVYLIYAKSKYRYVTWRSGGVDTKANPADLREKFAKP